MPYDPCQPLGALDLESLALAGPPNHLGVAKIPRQGLTLRFRSPCHPRSGLTGIYWGGRLDLKCAHCGTQVAALWIANPELATTPDFERAERLGVNATQLRRTDLQVR